MATDPTSAALLPALRASIRDVPDFPTPGILFKDVTPLLADPVLFRRALDAMTAPFIESGVSHVAAIESRGFLFGAPIALALGAALVPLRKVGKLPFHTARVDYSLEYGVAALEAHVDACGEGSQVLVVDDVLATGGTAEAACQLIEHLGGRVVGLAFLLALDALGGARRLEGRQVERLLAY